MCILLVVVRLFSGIADAAIEQARWDPLKVREKLRRDIDVYVTSVRAAKLSELTTLYEVCMASFNLGLEVSITFILFCKQNKMKLRIITVRIASHSLPHDLLAGTTQ